jgi:hypothetical protein
MVNNAAAVAAFFLFWTARSLASQRERQALKEEKYYPDKTTP